jgi:hypothetical protein
MQEIKWRYRSNGWTRCGANDAVGADRQVGQADPQGRRGEGLLPVPHEKTPSFTVSDDKGFYHCFGCGAHGDAIRWLVDSQRPGVHGRGQGTGRGRRHGRAGAIAPGAQREERSRKRADVLAPAADWYAQQLQADDGQSGAGRAASRRRRSTSSAWASRRRRRASPRAARAEALAPPGCWSKTAAAAPGATSSATG